jgi:glucose/arabinose dehydrogenase
MPRASSAASFCAVALAIVAGFAAPAGAIVLPSGFTESTVVANLTSPTAMAFAPDGRLFFCEQAGSLRVIKDGVLLTTPFVTLPAASTGELGLLGVAFDPDFPSSPYVYVSYTSAQRIDGTTALNQRIARWTAAGDVAQAGSEVVLFEVVYPDASEWHNGGGLHVSGDGKLMVSVGDHSQPQTAQSLTALTGKLLRLNRDGTIPTDNPFYNSTTGPYRAIWAYGLRNPFTFAVQPGTGRIFANDVGAASWEEVDDIVPGANYGWPTTEGATSDPAFHGPVYTYSHNPACAITGATFYDPPVSNFPSTYVDRYFFSDYCGRFINMIDTAHGNVVSTFASDTEREIVALQVASDGALYYLARNEAVIRRITYTQSNNPPTLTSQPADLTAPIGEPASFAVTASGTPPLQYQWQRNGADIAGATSSTYSIAAVKATDDGALFHCAVSNAQGTVTSRDARLTVTNNTRPRPSIDTPVAGTTYAAGQTIAYSGSAADTEDGTLPPSRFTWTVVFHHDTHTHPFLPPATGSANGSFVVPTDGETSTNVWYRIHLSVTDSGGLTQEVVRDVMPRVARLTLATAPAGLTISIDGQAALTSPASFDAVVGMTRAIGTAASQSMNGRLWRFVSWSDGGAATHNVTVPAAATTWTATFADAGPAPSPTPTPTATATPTVPPSPTPTAGTPTPTASGQALGVERHAAHIGLVRANAGAYMTSTQRIAVTAAGSWTATSDQSFVVVSPTSAAGSGLLSIDVADIGHLPASGTVKATVTVSAPGMLSSPQTISVDVTVYRAGTTAEPLGSFDSPQNGASGLQGSVAVTGWALDDIGLNRVDIYRDPVATESTNDKVFIGHATFVSGARPDVEAAHPNLPMSDRAGWGYMLATNMLPDAGAGTPAGGNGTFRLWAYLIDNEGNVRTLGPQTITVDNTHATRPFGTIDTPEQGATVSGTINDFGWVLTPQPAAVPTDGSTITLYIDGVARGTARYNLPRSDIQTLFPGYQNTDGAVGLFTIDTTTLPNGVHTIAWSATDSLGRTDGIGSRYFNVLN